MAKQQQQQSIKEVRPCKTMETAESITCHIIGYAIPIKSIL
jgi:hypothetical protein